MSGFFGLFDYAPEAEQRVIGDAFSPVLMARRARYVELRESTATLIFWRERTKAEIDARRLAVARLHDAARTFASAGDEGSAREALDEKYKMLEEIERAEEERADIGLEVAAAKERLMTLGREIEALERERALAVARVGVANVRSRLSREQLDTRSEKALAAARARVSEAVAEREIAELTREPIDRTAAELDLAVFKRRRVI